MIVPQQMIYPLRFISSWFEHDELAENEFRRNIARLLGSQSNVITLGRARAGLYLLTKSVLTTRRRRVILSPYTIPDVINMVKLAGGEPVFADCLPNSTNLDMAYLRTLLDDKTACVIITHYHLVQENTEEIAYLCRSQGLKLFDDCAISLGAQISNRPVGVITDGGVFSFSGYKVMNFFWGGMIATNSSELFELLNPEVAKWPRLKARSYTKQALKLGKYALATSPLIFPVVFRARRPMIMAGPIATVFPLSRIETTSLDNTIMSRPSLVAVREWNHKFTTVGSFLAHRRAIAAVYDQYFKRISICAEASDSSRAGSAFINYPIAVGVERRDHVYRQILKRGFDVALSLYPNVHEMETFTKIPGRSTNVSALVRSVVTLPTHARINVEYATNLATCVCEVLKSR